MIRIAIFGSGNGSNAQALYDRFKTHAQIKVCLILTENPDAFLIKRGVKMDIPVVVVGKSIYGSGLELNGLLERWQIDAVLLAGYLKSIPAETVAKFRNRILNIHPALLPAFGGKGMYGMNVHRAVIDSGAESSGLTIHLVTEKYDEGPILFQKEISIPPDMTPDELAAQIQAEERLRYPPVAEEYLLNFDFSTFR